MQLPKTAKNLLPDKPAIQSLSFFFETALAAPWFCLLYNLVVVYRNKPVFYLTLCH